MVAPYIHPRTIELADMVERSQKLAAIIVEPTMDNATRKQALLEKKANDETIMDFLKTANTGLVNSLVEKALSGLAIGAGIALPLAVGGSMVADRMADRSEAASERTWDRLSNAALGAAGIGAGLYALNRLTDNNGEKQATDEHEFLEDLMTKVATCVAIDELLGEPHELSEDGVKLAEEIRVLNNGYLTTILAQLA